MRIGGLQEHTLIDFPGRRAAVIFTQGCNFRCKYCHNPSLVDPQRMSDTLEQADIMDFLSERTGWLQGVVISGGEPTIHPDLPSFIRDIKQMGFDVKLDTNGTNPSMVDRLLEEGLVDYVAMDLKAPLDLERHKTIAGAHIDENMLTRMMQTIALLEASDIEHEFRTTAIAGVHSKQDLLQIGSVAGDSPYYLQRFRPEVTLDESWSQKRSCSDEVLQSVADKTGACIR